MSDLLLLKWSETLIPLRRVALLYFVNAYTWHNLWITLAALLFFYLCYLAGDLVLRRLGADLPSASLRAVLKVLAGYGVFGVAGLLLALLGYFESAPLRLFALAVVVASAKTIRTHLAAAAFAIRRPKRLGAALGTAFSGAPVLKAAIAVWLALNFFILFVPVTGYDALDYHLPIMNDLSNERRLTFNPEIASYRYLPVFAEVSYAVPMTIFGNDFPPGAPSVFGPGESLKARIPVFNGGAAPFVFQLIPYALLILFLVLVYDFLIRRVRWPFLAAAAVIGVLAIFDLEREVMHGGYVDVLVFLFGLASTFLIIEYGEAQRPQPRWLLLSALFVGVALGMKYLALFFLAINGLFLLAAAWRQSPSWPALIRQLLTYALVAAAIPAFWYAKNLVWFGNPVYPMFSDPEFARALEFFIAPRTPANFVLFPYHLFAQRFTNPDETASRLVVLAYFALAYFLIVALALRRERFGRAAIQLFVFAELFLLFAFLTSHHIRYLLPAVMVLPMLLALLLDRFYRRAGEWSVLTRRTLVSGSRLAMIAAAIVLLLGNIHYFHIRFNYITGTYSLERYLGDIGWQ